jgi:lysyl endopeptidase
MLLLDNGTRFCSGTLLNNACEDLTPNFLTAFHCVDVNQNGEISDLERNEIRTWVFRFQYRSDVCGGGDDNRFYSFSGARLRASWNVTDFALLLLNNRPTPESKIQYAGWTRETTPPRSTTNHYNYLAVHHPMGDVMKIAYNQNSPLTSVGWLNGPENTHWRAPFTHGIVEPGSSGSGLFARH